MIRLVGALLFLLLLCGCGIGSMKRGNMDMDAALLQMAREMREETIGAFMNENCTDAEYLQEAYALSLDERDYALVHTRFAATSGRKRQFFTAMRKTGV